MQPPAEGKDKPGGEKDDMCCHVFEELEETYRPNQEPQLYFVLGVRPYFGPLTRSIKTL
jgi:hypothetical protein